MSDGDYEHMVAHFADSLPGRPSVAVHKFMDTTGVLWESHEAEPRNARPRKREAEAPDWARNVFNPEGIAEGDVVILRNPEGEYADTMVVETVRGRNGNKVFCKEIGHELYATCFELVLKKAEYDNEHSRFGGPAKRGRTIKGKVSEGKRA